MGYSSSKTMIQDKDYSFLFGKNKNTESRFNPAQALWKHREKLATMRPRIERLHQATNQPVYFSLYQWAQFTAPELCLCRKLLPECCAFLAQTL
jgi:hypothetical protein